ncbi:hypothetical protein L1049_004059 [Liquidambar formosana]|uniref:RNase H type-1 domain-containing protein n=1 Tax=Liquidambar formosana TaxID=63359 RepID=A0AAP0RSL6_LIQFO
MIKVAIKEANLLTSKCMWNSVFELVILHSFGIHGAFSDTLGISSSEFAELMAVIRAIDLAWQKGWHSLWLECDSSLVLSYLDLAEPNIPWQLWTQWNNSMSFLRQMNFRCSHIFREGNIPADKLANRGVASSSFTWWDSVPAFIAPDVAYECNGLPYYRFRS